MRLVIRLQLVLILDSACFTPESFRPFYMEPFFYSFLDVPKGLLAVNNVRGNIREKTYR
jgi:hypothetical protein